MLVFTARSGESNYANCDGYYKPDLNKRELNGWPVYINAEKDRFLGRSDQHWVIGPLNALEGCLASQPAPVGGFHSCQAIEPELGEWKAYTVHRLEDCCALSRPNQEENDIFRLSS